MSAQPTRRLRFLSLIDRSIDSFTVAVHVIVLESFHFRDTVGFRRAAAARRVMDDDVRSRGAHTGGAFRCSSAPTGSTDNRWTTGG